MYKIGIRNFSENIFEIPSNCSDYTLGAILSGNSSLK
jgi:hypothetical protein